MAELDVLVGEIDEKVQQLQQFIAAGNVATFDEYKKTCGEIKGLLIARDTH